ncbi:AAA family ATPase [Bacillus thuringiensis]|uniref:AAA family ATPase n=1 Tax=Bacillus thuringiensis TaxID=1428 RepID=UPI001EE03B2F|nr:AAA family ATPase [Bacillus thuringiensis]MCG3425527.1 AAA family ATPase [Bacillus thuringiensis]
MYPQLLFVYTENLRNCFNNQNFCFTNDFDISFVSNQLLIHPKSNPYIDLFGEKISNINLIVGKNGAGKSTLLDLIGSPKTERMSLLNRHNGNFFSYIMLYHLKDNEFILEGTNFNIIKNLEGVPKGISHEYSIIITYDYKNCKAFYKKYIQSKTNSKKQATENEIAHILYYKNRPNYNWIKHESVVDQDTHVGVNRQYLNKTSLFSIYGFLAEESDAKQALRLSNIDNLFIKIEPGHIYSLNIYYEEFFELYGKHLDSILSLDEEMLIPHLQKKELPYSKKQLYIIKFLEIFTLKIVDCAYRLIKTPQQKEEFSKGLNNIIQSNEHPCKNYKNRLDYLEETIEFSDGFIENIEKYSNGYYIFATELLILFNSIDELYYTNANTIDIPLSEGIKPNISNILSFVQKKLPGFMHDCIDFKFGNMSYGETAFINIFSNIFNSISIADMNSKLKTIIIILDEPDLAFHPEWSRNLIYYLYNMLNNVVLSRNVKFQIFITTHSPFIVSDIPKELITCIEIVNDNGNTYRVVKKAEFGLMGNFYDIVQNNFFMSSPIGEFAKQLFKKILSNINMLEKIDKNERAYEIESIKLTINSIDELIIRKKLLQYLNEKQVELGEGSVD